MVEIFLFLTLVGLLLSMLFSSSEASIFSLSKIDLASLKSLGLKEKYINMIKNTEQLLFTLLTGNELADYFASFAFASAVTLLISEDFRTLAFVFYALFSFWIGDFLPKVAGFKYRTSLVLKIVPITHFFYQLLLPLRLIVYGIYLRINSLLPNIEENHKHRRFTPLEQIILHFLERAHKADKISETEKNFIYGLFLSEKIEVSTIMTTRSEIVAFQDQKITPEFLSKLKRVPFNKFPVYKESLDEIIGVLYSKDVIRFIAHNPNFQEKYLSEITRPAFFVPESFPVRDLLFEFQRKQLKIALVVDEYGTLKGLVTLEDILEELFGEILPEEEERLGPIQKIKEDHFLISGKALLEEAFDALGVPIEEEPFTDLRTVNGFILALFEGIPKEGESLSYRGWIFKIKKVRGRKVLWVEAYRDRNA